MMNLQAAFHSVVQKTYVAAVFDIDGTVTVRSQNAIPPRLEQKLIELSEKIPLALATARVCETSTKRIDELIAKARDQKAARRNWFLICENGARGLQWNEAAHAYEPLYTVPWPEEKISKKELFEKIFAVTKDCTGLNTMNVSSLSFRPLRTDHDTKDGLAKITAEITRRARPIFESYANHADFLLVDSGVGVHIMPKEGDKDRGVREFAKLLQKRGYAITDGAPEIAVFGDQPLPGMNDAVFLNGTWGTPFTVGDAVETPPPYTVYDEAGNRLEGPDATLHVLRKIFSQ